MALDRHSLPPRFRFTGIDPALLVLGVAGLLLWGFVLAGEHPDSMAAPEVTKEEAQNQAGLFLTAQGYSLDRLTPDVRLRRRSDLVLELQETLGRRGAVSFLGSTERNVVAAYYWHVRYLRSREPGSLQIGESEDAVFDVQLALNGRVLALQSNASQLNATIDRYGSASERVNRSALASVFRADTSTDAEARAALFAVSDSVFRSGVRFSLDAGRRFESEAGLNAVLNGEAVVLDSAAVMKLFNYQRSRTTYADLNLTLDSLSLERSGENTTARVRMVTDAPIAGQNMSVVADLSPTGTLARLSVSYDPVTQIVSKTANVLSGVKPGLLGLLGLIFVVVFFRRMIARLVDLKSALVDAMLLGIMAGLLISIDTTALSELTTASPPWAAALIRLVAFSVVAGAVSLFAFMVAGVTDSVVREAYEGKLGTLILLRHGDFQNQQMGSSLVRGLALGGLLLGITALALLASDSLTLSLSDSFLIDSSYRPLLASALSGFESAYFLSLLWVVGIGSLSFRWTRSSAVTIVVLVISGAILGAGPAPFVPTASAFLVSAASALLIAWAFIRFDIITVMMALFAAEVLWSVSEGFLVQGSGARIDFVLCGLFIGSVLILGFSGIMSKRTGQQAASYVPQYVAEMASQERVKSELEIARQVQSFFLPRTMPHVDGLDIAGMCLSANEVGGDYYDFIKLDDGRLAFVLGDVSGKGIQAAFFMTLVKGIVQSLSRQNMSPTDIMRRLNHLFCQNAPRGTFISVVYGEIDPKKRTFKFARAGHNPVIWYDASKQTSSALRPKGMAIGFSDGPAFDDSIEESTIQIKQGDALVFYTDGFSEAMNRSRALYGDDRLVEKVTTIGGRSASAILRLMTEDVHHFIEGMGRTDDMTMAVIKLN